MKLAELQRLMAADVMRPLTTADDLISPQNQASLYVKPNDTLTSAERLQIYNRGYWYRVLDSLREDFPGLRVLLGETAFTNLSEAYLADCPSTSFTLVNLGSKLEDWLRLNPQWAGRHADLTLDMVRLEWAHIEAFDRAALKEIGPEDLAEFSSTLKIQLQPHVRLLDLQYPVDELRTGAEIRAGARATGRRLTKAPLFVAVHRNDGYVYYRRLEPAEFNILQSLQRGGRLSTVLTRALHNQPVPADLQQWFAAWAQLGWLCHAKPPRKRRPAEP
ncbi:MAG: hypothetical protein QOJ99_4842 [Bryobacterales bacterium]|jgi:hypothetical protein|nr:hypothetical protein [Bryobacterales bacterium]